MSNWRKRTERALSMDIERSVERSALGRQTAHIDSFYDDMIENLRGLILHKSGSISAFAAENGVSRQNLSEVFSGRQDISVGLYLRLCASLNVVGPLPTMSSVCNVSLRDYLAVDHDTVIRSLLTVLLG